MHAKDGLVVLAINAWDDSRSTLEAFVKKDRLKQRVLLKGSGVAERYRVTALPTNVWIDRKGKIVEGGNGPYDLDATTKRLISGG